ncbi:MAG: hypothetical protein BAJALOKI1v1_460006 [Promethearchaeota archaeon]|nr:MAG: hypothetical protein BAJALOKI1v1_460006 [Candidatus Lokiarchaeota archaeon]
MPIGIFLYEIDSTSEPKILIDYHLKKQTISSAILKDLYKKHTQGIIDAVIQKGEVRFYSSMVKEKEDLYLGFILKMDEDLISLKSIFEEIELEIVENYDSLDKNKLKGYIKDTLNSITDLMDKLKNPEIIKAQLNNKTKKLLDENNIEEAKKLIDLGETVPMELSQLIQEAEAYFEQERFKKSKKKFLKAANLAQLIKEERIVSFLENKANKVGSFPDILEEREKIEDEIDEEYDKLEENLLEHYTSLIPKIKRLMEIANIFNQNDKYLVLSNYLSQLRQATRLAEKLDQINQDLLKKEFLN